MSGVAGKLAEIQLKLKSPKDQSANRYRYRSIEDINEALKPLAGALGCAVRYTDECMEVGGRLIVKSRCELWDGSDAASAEAWAIVDESFKGMSPGQACGAASSYARKYAACGLFAIDDSRHDPDAHPVQQPPQQYSAIDLVVAKRKLAEECEAYAVRNGKDPEEVVAEIKGRPDYREDQGDPAWFLAVADEIAAR